MSKADQVVAKVAETLVHQLAVRDGSVLPENRLVEDLFADDLDMVEIVMALEEQFGIIIKDEEIDICKTVGDVITCVLKKVAGKAGEGKCPACDSIEAFKKHPHGAEKIAMPEPNIVVKMEKVTFVLQKGNYSIILSVGPDRRMTLTTAFGKDTFMFNKSKPEVVEAIVGLMEKAVEVAKIYAIV